MGDCMSDGFDLIYTRKSDNRIYHVKKIIHGVYKKRDPLTGETESVTKYALSNHYEYQSKISNKSVRQKCQPIIMKYA